MGLSCPRKCDIALKIRHSLVHKSPKEITLIDSFKVLILLFASFVFSFSIIAAERIKYAYIEFPPITYTDQNGKPAGSLINIASRIFEKANLPWTAHAFPTSRMVKYLVEGEIDVWIGVTTLPELQDTTLVGNSTPMVLKFNAYSVDQQYRVKSPQDLVGKSVIIIRGYSYGGWINFIKDKNNNISYIEVNSHETALNALERKRAKIMLAYQSPMDAALENMPIENLQFTNILNLDCRIIVSKKAKNAEKLLQDLEAAFVSLNLDEQIEPKPKMLKLLLPDIFVDPKGAYPDSK